MYLLFILPLPHHFATLSFIIPHFLQNATVFIKNNANSLKSFSMLIRKAKTHSPYRKVRFFRYLSFHATVKRKRERRNIPQTTLLQSKAQRANPKRVLLFLRSCSAHILPIPLRNCKAQSIRRKEYPSRYPS